MRLEEGLDTGGVYAQQNGADRRDHDRRRTARDARRGGLRSARRDAGAPARRTGSATVVPQQGEPTYAAKFTAADFEIDWTDPVVDIHRLIRVGRSVDDVPVEAAEDQRRRVGRRSDRSDRRPTGGQVGDAVRCVAQRRPPVADRTVRGPVSAAEPRSARQVALDVLRRIEDDGAYANLALGPALTASGLGELDRKFVTELVYGTTRMRRACDALVDRFLTSPPDAVTRTVLRLGAYQVAYAGVPAARRRRRDRRAVAEADPGSRQCRAAQGRPVVDRGDDLAIGRRPAELPGLDRRHVPERTG